MDHNVHIGWLLDFYGPLLTAHQLEALRLKYDEDFTLAEIAEGMNVSRQAVHDAIRRGEASLLDWEERLGLMRRHEERQHTLRTCARLLAERAPHDDILAQLTPLLDREAEADGV